MRVDIITIFPAICAGPLGESMLKRARDKGLLDLHVHDLRRWATDKHRVVDDAPFGGGQGMVLKPEPIFAAVEELRTPESRVILMTPQGGRFNQVRAGQLAALPHLVIVCGHYEGVDHRVVEHLVDEEISIGDYVLTNGAIAAAVLVGTVAARLASRRPRRRTVGRDDSFCKGATARAGADPPWPKFRGWNIPPMFPLRRSCPRTPGGARKRAWTTRRDWGRTCWKRAGERRSGVGSWSSVNRHRYWGKVGRSVIGNGGTCFAGPRTSRSRPLAVKSAPSFKQGHAATSFGR